MATKQDVAPRAQRLAALGAVAFLATATALAFGRVFRGEVPTLKLVVAALASVAIAAALERRSLLLATFLSAAGLVVVMGLFVFPETTWAGLPTRETLRAAADALGRVGHEARVQVAPSEPLRPLMLAALTAVWTASFSAHALALRAGSPLLAVLPPVALVGFADTVLEDGARPMYALLLLAAALLVVFSDGLRRIRQWGPVWSSPGRRRLSSVAGRGARRVGITAIVAALAFPGVLPGFRDRALVDFSTSGGEGVRLDPWVSIRSNLSRDTPIPLYHVSSTDPLGNRFPSYWRSFALDLFNGQDWTSSDPEGARGQPIGGSADLGAGVVAPANAVTHVTQTFELLRDQEDLSLPMAYPVASLRVPVGLLRYNADLGSVTARGTLSADASYTVASDVVIPTPAELDAVVPVSPAPKYTFLPESTPEEIYAIADRWAADASAPTPYRRVLAIQDHLTDPTKFEYSENVDLSDDSDALLNFLTKTHRGFCQQFAASMAVLVRALGYPARVAVGYRTGTASGDSYLVTSHDAHAWVEVDFPGYGWLTFEPTPRRPNPIAQLTGSYLNPATTVADVDRPSGEEQGTAGSQGATPNGPASCLIAGRRVPIRICNEVGQTAPRRFGAGRRFGPGTRLDFSRPDDGYGVPIRLLLGVVLLLALVLLVLVPAVKWAVRLRIAHRRAPPRETVLAAFRLFDGEAADLGLGRRPGETLTEYRRRLDERVPFSDGHLGRLTEIVSRAAYAPQEIDGEQAHGALRDARIAIRDVRKDAGVVRRVVGVYRPGI
jgi:transglutaminase-like putative cysteine protease